MKPLTNSDRPKSARAMGALERLLPGGVSSDVRMGGPALVFDRADGAYLYDLDGHRYLDYVMGMGPLILGHTPPAVVAAVQKQAARGLIYAGQHEFEGKVAEQIRSVVPCAQMMRFSSSGSEAVHGAFRLARGFTGRQKIVKFEGHYHGWLDSVLYSTAVVPEKAGDAKAPNAVPMTGGMAASTAADVLVAPWNDADALAALLERNGGQVAAVIMEALMCNTGCIDPLPGYLERVQQLCREHGALLIFDEVITGFRLGKGGVQQYTGITPDLATFGKAVAAGLPLSVVAGRADVMGQITDRKVMHAGTFNSNPLVMAGAHAGLQELLADDGAVYGRITRSGQQLRDGINALAARYGVPATVAGPGPMLQIYFGAGEPIRNARDVAATDHGARIRFVDEMLNRGVRLTSRGLVFLSSAHGESEVGETLAAAEDVFRQW